MREINYDEVLFNKKLAITIDKKKYVISEPTLQQIIDYEQSVKELIDAGESGASSSEAGEKWIEVIRTVFSSIPTEVLRKKSMLFIRRVAKDCTDFMKECMFDDAPEQETTKQPKGDKKKVK